MATPRWLLALPLALAATFGTARAASVRDTAGMFSPEAVREAEVELTRIEREFRITTTIETVASLEGEDVADVAREHAERSGRHGIYILLAKKEAKIDIRASRQYSRVFNESRERAVRDAFVRDFKKRDFDRGLLDGVKTVRSEVAAAVAESGNLRPAQGVPLRRPVGGPRPGNPNGAFGVGSLLGLGLLIVGVLFVVRLLGSVFGGRSFGQPGRMGGPGYGPGYGGGGGGGFMSSLFGGIGGAMAGNWLYDQFSGRHQGGYVDQSNYGGDQGVSDTGADDWSSGSNTSGGWGGGDSGGGGDWGGGGGDWGGGGDTGGGDW